jgi:molybdopterin converting factor small subunit
VRGALAAVAARHPALVGTVLAADGCTPAEHYLVNLDGRRFLHDLDEVLPDGSHVLLMSAVAGGRPDPADG